VTRSKIAIIGTRGHYREVLREAGKTPEAQIVAVAPGGAGDDDVTPILESCRSNGVAEPRVFDDYRNMLDTALPDIVVICGPLELHAAMSITAIERDIHVLTEKPAALTLSDLAALQDTCERHPKVHLAGMMFSRYTPGFYTAWRMIHLGAVGDIRLIDARKSYKLGKRPAYYQHRETYGGTIPWVGSHAIDWILWLGGHQIESVYATHSTAHNGDNRSLESSALCHFTLAGGRAASVSVDFFRPENAPTHGDDWARIVGTEGIMEVRPDKVTLINSDGNGAAPVDTACDRRPLEDFLAHIDGKRAALIDRKATLEMTRACLVARQSADEGKVLRLDPAGLG
jgi:predicted dehydrogenase